MSSRMKLLILLVLALLSVALYLFYQLGSNWDYVLPRRGYKVGAMVVAGGAIAFSTVIFQTVTHNRILTPSIMGLDSLYLLVQTLLVFFLGGKSFSMISNEWLFLLSVSVLVVFSLLLLKGYWERRAFCLLPAIDWYCARRALPESFDLYASVD